jgi:hypothetical protein
VTYLSVAPHARIGDRGALNVWIPNESTRE